MTLLQYPINLANTLVEDMLLLMGEDDIAETDN
jgi:hypothetical protein